MPRIKYRKRGIEKLITMNYSSEKKMEMMQLLDAIIQLFSISSLLTKYFSGHIKEEIKKYLVARTGWNENK
jgi:hypothetical protein